MSSVIKQHAIELEKAMGGNGNGIFTLKSNKIQKSLKLKKILKFIEKGNFLFHTRFATVGSIKTENCHPFYYKDTIFMHNGGTFINNWDFNDRPDSYNLIIYYLNSQGQNLKLMDLDWWGNLILYDKITKIIYFYLKQGMYHITFKTGESIVTSQFTDILTKNKNISSVEKIENGIYIGEFGSQFISKINSRNE
jgi:predicted glutamine amidotransferase